MIPILFDKAEANFTSNGLGRLPDAISCIVTEERNGQYELAMVYPISGINYNLLDNDMIIGVIPSVGATLQPFDIYNISKPLSGKVTINARHISYRLQKIVTQGADVAASNSACTNALASLISGAILATGQSFGFNFWTDVDTVSSFKKSVPQSVKARLGGSDGSILDQFGGEFEWDKFTVKLHKNRGVNSNITIKYGKNLTDITQDESISDIITGCVGYWKNNDNIIVGDVQLASNHASFVREKIISVDFTQQLGTESSPTKSAINNLAQIYANQHNLPKVNMKVSFVDLSKTEEYKDYAPLEQLHLCDYVYVNFQKLGISQYARVIKTVYNVLEDKYNSIEIGENISTLFSVVNDSLNEALSGIDYEALNATAWLTRGDGYVVAVKNNDGSWKELLFLDTNDIATAHNVLRLNTNGLGFSKTGVNGAYTNAWTIDGHLSADFIFGGTLTLGGSTNGSLSVKNASNGVIMSANKNGIAINGDIFTVNSTNFKLTANGTLTANNANLTNMRTRNMFCTDGFGISGYLRDSNGSGGYDSIRLDTDPYGIYLRQDNSFIEGTYDYSQITIRADRIEIGHYWDDIMGNPHGSSRTYSYS